MHEDLRIDRFDLITDSKSISLAHQISSDFESVSPETRIDFRIVDLADPWDFEEVFTALYDLSELLRINPQAEDLLVHITTGTHVCQICLFLLTEAKFLPGRLIQTSPERRHLPRGTYHIIDLDLARYDGIARRFATRTEDAHSFLKSGISTRSDRFNRLIERIEKVALRSREPMLLTGPTGAGKSQLARKIFALKKARRLVEGRFVEINCATLRGEGAMSALFGHRAGAFTGAVKARPGLLREADEGVLFLDEIGELGLDEQAMLLRAIEEKRFLPLGADQELESDFQLLAGTNRDLREAVRRGDFREDLLARINLWTFEMPALRERLEDIEPNLEFELARFSTDEGTRVNFNTEARDAFLRFATSRAAAWNGNFRDLNAAMKRMCTLAPGGRIDVETVDEEIARLERSWLGSEEPDRSLLRRVVSDEAMSQLDRFDRTQLEDVVGVCAQSVSLSEAGRTLFAVSRERKKVANDADRLRKYLARFGLSFGEIRDSLEKPRLDAEPLSRT